MNFDQPCGREREFDVVLADIGNSRSVTIQLVVVGALGLAYGLLRSHLRHRNAAQPTA